MIYVSLAFLHRLLVCETRESAMAAEERESRLALQLRHGGKKYGE